MLSLIDAINDQRLFLPWFEGASWDGWKAILKAAYALPMTESEIAFFRSVADRNPPQRQVRECWFVCGRRAGKDSIASLMTAHAAAFFDPHGRLRKGERALCAIIAVDRPQSRICLNLIRSFFTDIPPLAAMVKRETVDGFELINDCDVSIITNDFRSIRGRSILRCTLDEVAFYASDNSSAPDFETYYAATPGMVTIPGSMLIGISSPYRQAGLLFDKFTKHYGKDDDDVLVVRAPSIALNPTLDQTFIDKEIASDPAAKRAEWLAEWRSDIAALLDPALIDTCIIKGRNELPYNPTMRPVAFLDSASGVGKDAMVLAIAYQDILTERAVLACIREVRPPFSPEQICAEFAETMRSYRVHRIISDRYSLNWVAERFRAHGVTVEYSHKTRSELYRALLPLISSDRIELLDNPRLRTQLASLERRVSRGTGHETIDAPSGLSEDTANAAAGALVYASQPRSYDTGIAVTAVPAPGSPLWGRGISDELRRRVMFIEDDPNLPPPPPKYATV